MLIPLLRRILASPLSPSRSIVTQVIKFGTVGVSNTLVDYAVYVFLTRLIPFFRLENHFLYANFISFSIAVSNSYYWNRRWTFRDSSSDLTRQFSKFFLVNVIGFGLNETTLFLLVRYAGFHDLIAKAFAIAVALGSNFLFSRFWVFPKGVVKT